MTAAAKLIGGLARAGGYLSVHEEGLRFHGPSKLLTSELRHALRQHRHELLEWLRTPFSDQSVADQLALDYERTVPDWLLERIHETWGRDTCGGSQ